MNGKTRRWTLAISLFLVLLVACGFLVYRIGQAAVCSTGFNGYKLLALTADGRILSDCPRDLVWQNDYSKWEDITSLATGGQLDAGLKADGRVIAFYSGPSSLSSSRTITQKICDTSGWTDITTITCGPEYVVGLRSAGTVVAAGTNEMKGATCLEVSAWTGITALAAGRSPNVLYPWTAGLRADGTVAIAGEDPGMQHFAGIREWAGITAIAIGEGRLLGLRRDGTVMASGNGGYEASRWTSIMAIAGSTDLAIGLKADGTVLVCGSRLDAATAEKIGSWTDIVSIAAGERIVAGTLSDGTLVAAINPAGANVSKVQEEFTTAVVKMNAASKVSMPTPTPTVISVEEPGFEYGVKPVLIGEYAPDAYEAISFSMQDMGFEKGSRVSVLAIDNGLNLITSKAYTKDGVTREDLGIEIGIYDPHSKKYTKVSQTSPDATAWILEADERYVAWQERLTIVGEKTAEQSAVEARFPIHIYDRETGEDISFSLNDINDGIEAVYTTNANQKYAYLLDGNLYLTAWSDYCQYSVFRFDIADRVLAKLMDSAQDLFLHENRATWIYTNSVTHMLDLYQDSEEGPILLAKSVGTPEKLTEYFGKPLDYHPDADLVWSTDKSVPEALSLSIGYSRDVLYSIRGGVPSLIIGKGSLNNIYVLYLQHGRYLAIMAYNIAGLITESNFIYDGEKNLLLLVTKAKAGTFFDRFHTENKVVFLDPGMDASDLANVQTLHCIDLGKLE